MIRNPRERFSSSTFSGAWGKVVQSELYEEAIFAALNELLNEMPKDTPVPQVACDAHQQMVGARKYMEILSNIYLPAETPQTAQPKGLDYQSGV